MKHLFCLAVISIALFSCEKDDSDIVSSNESLKIEEFNLMSEDDSERACSSLASEIASDSGPVTSSIPK